MRTLLLAILLPLVCSAQMLFYQSSGDFSGGQKIVLDGSTQYLSIADNTGSLDETLDMDVDDFMITFLVKFSALPTAGDSMNFSNKYSTYGYSVYIYCVDSSLYYFNFILTDAGGTTSASHTFRASPVVGRWYAYALVVDRSDKSRLFIDGIFQSYYDISARTGSLSNAGSFFIGARYDAASKLAGTLDAFRVFRLGYGGLYVAGSGGSNLKIQVGSSSGPVLYDETAPNSTTMTGGLIPRLFRSPYSTLATLGFSGLDNAVRTNLAVNGSDWTDSNSDGAADNWDVSGTSAIKTIITDAEFTGNAQKVEAGLTINTSITQALTDKLVIGSRYSVKCRCRANNGVGIYVYGPSLTMYLNNASCASATNFNFVTNQASDAGNSNTLRFYLRSSDGNAQAGDYIIIDDISFRKIGEVAYWRFNGNLNDETGNALHLTGTGSPTYAGN